MSAPGHRTYGTDEQEDRAWPGVAGRVALVTGGAMGTGAGVAHRLAQGGARVGVLDLSLAAAEAVVKQIADDGGTALALERPRSQTSVTEHLS